MTQRRNEIKMKIRKICKTTDKICKTEKLQNPVLQKSVDLVWTWNIKRQRHVWYAHM